MTNAKGQPVTYYSAFALDAEPNPLLRYPGQIEFQPSEEEIKDKGIVEGANFSLFIMGINNLRNGIPVCQVKLAVPGSVGDKRKSA
ncbi:MAG TPA: hypothetical protein DDZ88_06510 [Verrucomicrobiales bacterium]|nr:hypothetical protein [Verrucomicrobiales bacterium]